MTRMRCPYSWQDCVLNHAWRCMKPAGHNGRHRLRRVDPPAVIVANREAQVVNRLCPSRSEPLPPKMLVPPQSNVGGEVYSDQVTAPRPR